MQLSSLTNSKNLLAFSAGIDSSALFFMLLENNIPFDIALVNYRTRSQSGEEEAHALKLADQYRLKAYTIKAPHWQSHFEANARKFRYDFFERLIEEYHYDNLLTAHQLNDQLEWLLMRLSKGAGLSELLGLQESSERKTGAGRKYMLIRPLLEHSKSELLEYLETNHYPYFIDESNQDTDFERNDIRKHFSDPFMKKYGSGVKRSFEYLHKDRELLQSGIKNIYEKGRLRVLHLDSPNLKVRAADRTLKELGYLLSAEQRKEIETKNSIVIGGEWAVAYQDNRLFVAPFVNSIMPKKFKELCRVSRLPIKVRPYCHLKEIKPSDVMALS